MAKLTITALKITKETMFAKVAPADNAYVAGGVQLNLSPGGIAAPSALGVTGPSFPGLVPPGVFSESLGGYYAQITKGSTLANGVLQYFAPGGAELAAGAYPAAITGGTLVIAIPFEQ